MTTVPVATGEPPEKPSPDPVTGPLERGSITPIEAPEYVSFDELLDAAFVLQPPCRSHSRGWLGMADRVTSGEWKHTWQAVVLITVVGVVASCVLLAGSVLLQAAALSVTGLGALLWLSRRNADRAPRQA
ncbi:hypothetical protein SD37_05295 [Amycolatopsis orientalis]|uniref:Uncharacterized protein n=1 Tax=Amycolatopsis orientalis TaxID=31958 RepID=A0A193BSH3_AMYOR|nr:hypothetical protein [Amycolatopsis orientalis]ANN15133.1 hypothetical protein SD37_05295 [Amycolatopsis orientalis]